MIYEWSPSLLHEYFGFHQDWGGGSKSVSSSGGSRAAFRGNMQRIKRRKRM